MSWLIFIIWPFFLFKSLVAFLLTYIDQRLYTCKWTDRFGNKIPRQWLFKNSKDQNLPKLIQWQSYCSISRKFYWVFGSLLLNNVTKVDFNTAMALVKCWRKLLHMDLSWYRQIIDEAFWLIPYFLARDHVADSLPLSVCF